MSAELATLHLLIHTLTLIVWKVITICEPENVTLDSALLFASALAGEFAFLAVLVISLF
jgi:hypothetical protein